MINPEKYFSYFRIRTGRKNQYEDIYNNLKQYDGRPYVDSMKKAIEHYTEYISKAHPSTDTVRIRFETDNIMYLFWGKMYSADGGKIDLTSSYVKYYQVQPFKELTKEEATKKTETKSDKKEEKKEEKKPDEKIILGLFSGPLIKGKFKKPEYKKTLIQYVQTHMASNYEDDAKLSKKQEYDMIIEIIKSWIEENEDKIEE